MERAPLRIFSIINGLVLLTNPKFDTDMRSECPLKSRKHEWSSIKFKSYF